MSDDTPRSRAPWWAPYVTVILLAVIGAGAYVATQFVGGEPAPGPAPSSTSLAALVPEPTSRAKLARFYADFADVVAAPECPLKTTGQFEQAQAMAVAHYKAVERLPDIESIDKPIRELIGHWVGFENAALTPDKKERLAEVLRRISQDFAG